MGRIKVTVYLNKEAVQAIDYVVARRFELEDAKPERSHVVEEAVLKLRDEVKGRG